MERFVSMQRTIHLNPVEPALLSLRTPLGVDLTLDVTMRTQQNAPVDPTSVLPQLALLPRSLGGVFGYDMAVQDAVNGIVRAKVPGSALVDRHGYTLEMYSRRTADNPADPPVPTGLIAKGVVVLEGNAYQQMGPFAPIAVPTIVGPQGPKGDTGATGATGPTGQRGSIWTSGVGVPVATGNELPGDMYLDESNGDVYRYEEGVGWRLRQF